MQPIAPAAEFQNLTGSEAAGVSNQSEDDVNDDHDDDDNDDNNDDEPASKAKNDIFH